MPFPSGWTLEATGDSENLLIGSLDVEEGGTNGTLFEAGALPGGAFRQSFGVLAFTIVAEGGSGGGEVPCDPKTARDVFPNNAGAVAGGSSGSVVWDGGGQWDEGGAVWD